MDNNDYFLLNGSKEPANHAKKFSFKSLLRNKIILITAVTVLLVGIVVSAVVLTVIKSNKSKKSSLTAVSSEDFSSYESENEASDLESVSVVESTEASSESPESQTQAQNAALSSIINTVDKEKAEVKPSTGNVFTAPEYQYNSAEDVKVPERDSADIDTDDGEINSPPSNTDTPENSAEKIVRITATEVNIRDNPSTSGSKLGQANTNDEFTYLGEKEDSKQTIWYKISYNNGVGWVISTYSQVIDNPNTSSSGSDASSETQSSNTETGSNDITSSDSAQNSSSEGAVSYNGWTTIDNKTYYYSNNQPCKGWKDIDGFRYYFDESTGEKKSSPGIDVSRYQGNIDWKKVKQSGVEFAFIRVGYRGYETGKISIDPNFVQNITEAQKNGIKCGVYFYSVALNTTEAAEEANFVLEAVKNYTLDLPIVIDCEHKTDRVSGLSKAERTDNVLAFLATVQAQGYSGCLYTGHYFYNNLLEHQRLSSVKLWIAYYTNNPDKVADVNYTYWQYTASGAVAGISGNVDMNVWVYK